MGAQDFSDEQKRYLEGFVSGVQASRAAAGLRPLGGIGGADGAGEPMGPDKEHLAAMARFEAEGGKLSPEEKAKREEHPFDAYARLKDEALKGHFPKGVDNFRWRYHGLYYVAPTQNAFMCRMRIPNGILTHWQLRGIADVAERYGGGYAHVTTRANLQIREIAAENGPALIEALADLGVNPKGSGADNIRNVTGSATAGIDRQELIDTRPFARAWHHHILNDRSLYGLPRKFNVAFDGGGSIPTLDETNDIAFTAVTVKDGAESAEAGVWFRLGLGGITGHKDFARPTGAYVKPEDAVKVADAIVRVFTDHGDRTDRKKARLKYVLDAWGFERFLAAVEGKLGRPLARIADAHVVAPPKADRLAHIGVHPQKQAGLAWIGVSLPVGRMSVAQMHGIADIAWRHGDGDVRLTVWQNLIVSGVKIAAAAKVEAALAGIGLTSKASSVRAGLVACTGNTGCKFALANTKDTALAIATHVEAQVAMDTPVNIHLTGCPNSCAQHYIGDIGMIATRVPVAPDSDDTVEGFNVHIGGGYGPDAQIAREIFPQTRVEDLPGLVERMLRAYLAHRETPTETFLGFAQRHDIAALRAMIETSGSAP
ncbi:MAG: NirA family protein [Hyphomicrobiaceae bacterium]|nr:NirA family protein [Hyphomicrobiaceae bacterium]